MRTLPDCEKRLIAAGITPEDAQALRRISMTLHRWYELECGDSYGVITRDGKDVPRFHGVDQNGAYRTEGYIIPDRERGAIKRLKRIMKCYPTLRPYIQGDPRGPALYILRPGDVPEGERDESFYSNGIAVMK